MNVSPLTACTIGPQVLNARYGPGVPEPAVRHVDDVGADLAGALVAEAEPLEHTGGEVLGDDVAHRAAACQQLAAFLGRLRSIVTPSLLTLWLLNPPPRSTPRRSSTYGPTTRIMSQRPWVVGSSTRITSAPNIGEHLRRARPGELPAEVADAHVAESAHRDQSRGLSKKFG